MACAAYALQRHNRIVPPPDKPSNCASRYKPSYLYRLLVTCVHLPVLEVLSTPPQYGSASTSNASKGVEINLEVWLGDLNDGPCGFHQVIKCGAFLVEKTPYLGRPAEDYQSMNLSLSKLQICPIHPILSSARTIS